MLFFFNANIVDPDQMSRSGASDLSLRCLRMPFYMMSGITGLKS